MTVSCEITFIYLLHVYYELPLAHHHTQSNTYGAQIPLKNGYLTNNCRVTIKGLLHYTAFVLQVPIYSTSCVKLSFKECYIK